MLTSKVPNRRTIKMPCCCAVNCYNRSGNKIRLFRFPRDPERRAKWIQNTRRSNGIPSVNIYLCELHFENSQYEQNRKDGWRKLKPNAIPTLFNVSKPPSLMINPPPQESVHKKNYANKSVSNATVMGSLIVQLQDNADSLVAHQTEVKSEELESDYLNLKEEPRESLEEDEEVVNLPLAVWVKEDREDIDEEYEDELNPPAAGWVKKEREESDEEYEENFALRDKNSTCFSTEAECSNISEDDPGVPSSEEKGKPSICGKIYSTMGNVGQTLTDVGEKLYKCSECGKGYSTSSCLMTHIHTHTGEKRVTCSVCGKELCGKRYLLLHMRTHTGEKPEICSICGRGFAQSSALMRHMTTHTGEKSVKCFVCGRCFLRKDYLNKHMRTHMD